MFSAYQMTSLIYNVNYKLIYVLRLGNYNIFIYFIAQKICYLIQMLVIELVIYF